MLQDVCLILALGALLLTFFSTYVFQAGLIELLYDRFRLTIIICMVYFIFTTILHTMERSITAQLVYRASCILQRFMAPIYYYFYKRAALRISDSRFYEDIEWVQPVQVSQCGK